jgi:hypothetical protein
MCHSFGYVLYGSLATIGIEKFRISCAAKVKTVKTG